MDKKIIDLNLREHSKESKPLVTLSNVIQKNNLIVILGSPGSGKTSILKKYSLENSKSKFIKIKKFLRLDYPSDTSTEVLLLDGLDEYRSLSTDKTFVIEELADKLKNLKDMTIVISCRELDWYGESDKGALKDELNQEALVFSVEPLDKNKQMELAEALEVNAPQEFIEKFSSYGFLNNPQMFKMIVELYNQNDESFFSSKSELYKAFIQGAKEQNNERVRNISNQLTGDEVLKYSGYLAFFYMFTNIDIFDDDFIDSISDKKRGFSRDNLMQVLNTTLFDQQTFIHRTVAEYALAYFLVTEKKQYPNSMAKERVKALFVRNGKIPTELRGVYAWICSLVFDKTFIDVDPFYQAVYGDNSLFLYKEKKEIVLSVKRYAVEHPYFIDFWNMRSYWKSIGSLYSSDLDDFYMQEFQMSMQLKNHYKYFIISILNQSAHLSSTIKQFLQKQVFDKDIPANLKDDILQAFEEDKDFLAKVLYAVRDEEIEDEDNQIKEFLLKRLYLDLVAPNEIIDYLRLYKRSERIVVGDGMYLFDTQYKDKLDLVISLLKLKQEILDKEEKGKHRFRFSDFMKKFVSDFLYETAMMYPEKMSASEVYNIIIKLRKYVDRYKYFEFKPYSWVRRENNAESDEKRFKEFASELYSIHLNKAIESSPKSWKDISGFLYDFRFLFPYFPKNMFDLLLGKINSENSMSINKRLFIEALTYIPFGYENNLEEYSGKIEKLQEVSKQYGFKDELDSGLNQKPSKWSIEDLEYKRKEVLETQKIKEKNEEYFLEKNDEKILSSFNALKYISDLLYFGENETEEVKYLELKTFERLKLILKELISHKSIDDTLTTIESLAKLKNRSRAIESVYFVSLSLNEFLKDGNTIAINNKLIRYLYINHLQHSNIGNIVKSDFCDYLERDNPNKAIDSLQEFIKSLIQNHYKSLNFIFTKYIYGEKDIKSLKKIAYSYESNLGTIQEELLNNILTVYAFDLTKSELNKIYNKLEEGNKNRLVLESLIVLNKEDKKSFTIEMASSLFRLFEYSSIFETMQKSLKIRLLDYMFSVFDSEEYLKLHDGFQSLQSQCASFLQDIIKILDLEILKALYKTHQDTNDIWRNKILNQIDTLMQQEADQNFDRYPINKIKAFVLSDSIVSEVDFFEDISLKLNSLKNEIEDNRDNEKKLFYNDDGTAKDEEYCRDVILQKLNDKYGYDIDITKEKHEADNRVDMNIRYRANLNYEVQIECKKDFNQELYKGIPNQLIDKYLSSKVQFGVYFIFYFGERKNKKNMLMRIRQSIPSGYEDRVKIICIDLKA